MIKRFLKSFVEMGGCEILGPDRAYAARRSLMGLIQQEKINLVLDVGANTGQFVDELRAAGYSGRIISFEPLSSAHDKLKSRAAGDLNWTIADRAAVGAREDIVEIHIAGNGASSSILNMLPNHTEAAPETAYVGTERVPVRRLDDICPLSPTDRPLLKIDVQGFEKEVLKGAERVMTSCRGVISELSLVPLYDQQVLANEMLELLETKGFETWSIEPGFRNPQTGRMLQVDGYFVRHT